MNEKRTPLDLNSAERDELTSLPGIGPNIAEKIIAARPFFTIEDLRGISGIGQVVFERIAPLIFVPQDEVHLEQMQEEGLAAQLIDNKTMDTFEEAKTLGGTMPDFEEQVDLPPFPEEKESQPVQPEATEEIQEPPVEPSVTPSPVEIYSIPVVEPKSDQPRRISKVPSTSRPSEVYGIALTCSAVTLFLSIALTFGIFFLINNGLHYITPAELIKTEQKLSEISAQTADLSRDIDSLRTRLDNLESIAGRVSLVEKEMKQIGAQLDTLSSNVGSITQQIGELTSQLEELQISSKQFRTFLDGLKNLLEDLPSP